MWHYGAISLLASIVNAREILRNKPCQRRNNSSCLGSASEIVSAPQGTFFLPSFTYINPQSHPLIDPPISSRTIPRHHPPPHPSPPLTPPNMPTPLLRPTLRPFSPPSLLLSFHQTRSARLLRRPKRPYTFTQLITLSDGSAFTLRTTSPLPVYRSTRDTRNSPLWNPRSRDLQNVESDEAGRLRGFRERFGGGFDAKTLQEGEGEESQRGKDDGMEESYDGLEDGDGFSEEDANLMDLISAYNVEDGNKGQPWQLQKEKRDKKK